MSDCPLAPNREYRQGFPDGSIKTVAYIAPCKDWDGVYCNWFEPPQRVSELLEPTKKVRVK